MDTKMLQKIDISCDISTNKTEVKSLFAEEKKKVKYQNGTSIILQTQCSISVAPRDFFLLA